MPTPRVSVQAKANEPGRFQLLKCCQISDIKNPFCHFLFIQKDTKTRNVFVTLLDGTRHKNHRVDKCGRYVEIFFESQHAQQYLKKDVSERFYGKEQMDRAIISSVNQTDMHSEELEKILKTDISPIGWRIGEYIAITAMEKFFQANIYHDPNRETTSPNANLTGPDLVGTIKMKDKTVFLLGEVKTSGHAQRPPAVMHKLATELKGLDGIYEARAKTAIRWMLLHKDEYDKDAIDEALENYPHRKIVGALVRDTEPDIKDMLQAYTKLVASLSKNTFLLMVALYIPIKIDDFEKFMVA